MCLEAFDTITNHKPPASTSSEPLLHYPCYCTLLLCCYTYPCYLPCASQPTTSTTNAPASTNSAPLLHHPCNCMLPMRYCTTLATCPVPRGP